MNGDRGFTLIEVVVALAVVAIGLLALVATASQHTRQASALEERSVANWVATDRLVELRLQDGFPELGIQEGTQHMLGRDWSWRAIISEAPGESDLRRIDVEVAPGLEIESPTVRLTGFVGRYRFTTTAETQ